MLYRHFRPSGILPNALDLAYEVPSDLKTIYVVMESLAGLEGIPPQKGDGHMKYLIEALKNIATRGIACRVHFYKRYDFIQLKMVYIIP